ncbi:acyl-homoserine-lactone synthase [Azospirillum sp. B4]|uniref:acyl-homoserine-lactone synthase n=1 Tax=Azospirillum sp. B4 TaxID=95605 RepID=UPI000347268A|nr:acyl-homoserine-lactone synthase [Azospirillum sp. B4]
MTTKGNGLNVRRFQYRHAREMAQAWRLRNEVFRQRKGWPIPAMYGLEMDHLDKVAEHLGVFLGDQLVAYLRLLRCDGHTLWADSFPQFLVSLPCPPALAWEASRFAVADIGRLSTSAARLLVRQGLALGQALGAELLLAVTEPDFALFLRRSGVPLDDLVAPQVVGHSIQGPVRALLVSTRLPANSSCQLRHFPLPAAGPARREAAALRLACRLPSKAA